MALKRNERYPGRYSNPSTDHPQGAFKNRTAPNAQDGSYLEQDWTNDWDGFFGRLLTVAGITPNGAVDTASTSQYYDALAAIFIAGTVPISRGGTGATTASAARTALGLLSAATRDVGTGINQIPDMSSFTASLEQNGWEKMPSGLIRQWGYVTMTGSEGPPQTFDLPIPFPNVALSAQISIQYATNVSGNMAIYVSSLSNSSITIVQDNASATQKANVYYEVIGK